MAMRECSVLFSSSSNSSKLVSVAIPENACSSEDLRRKLFEAEGKKFPGTIHTKGRHEETMVDNSCCCHVARSFLSTVPASSLFCAQGTSCPSTLHRSSPGRAAEQAPEKRTAKKAKHECSARHLDPSNSRVDKLINTQLSGKVKCALCFELLSSPCLSCSNAKARAEELPPELSGTADPDAEDEVGKVCALTSSSNCRHSVHAHCTPNYLRSNPRCPVCAESWSFETFAKADTSSLAAASTGYKVLCFVSRESTVPPLTLCFASPPTLAQAAERLGQEHKVGEKELMYQREQVRHLPASTVLPDGACLCLCGREAHPTTFCFKIVQKKEKQEGSRAAAGKADTSALFLEKRGNETVQALKQDICGLVGTLPDCQTLLVQDAGDDDSDMRDEAQDEKSALTDQALLGRIFGELPVSGGKAQVCLVLLERPPERLPMLDLFHKESGLRLLQPQIGGAVAEWPLVANWRTCYQGDSVSRLDNKSYQKDYTGHSAQGVQDLFANCDAWQPMQQAQAQSALATFLSSLYVFTDSLSKDGPAAAAFEVKLAQLGFSAAAVLAWHNLVKRRSSLFGNAEKAVLANSFYHLFRALAPPDFANAVLFGQTRYLLAYLTTLTEPSPSFSSSSSSSSVSATPAAIKWKQADLECEACSLLIQETALSVTVEEASTEQLQQQRKKDLVCCASCAAKSTLNSQGKSYRVLSSAPHPSLSTIARAYPKRSGGLEWCVSSSWPAAWPSVPRIGSWKHVVRDTARAAALKLVPPLSLSRAPKPCLTLDEQGSLAVFTGRGKDLENSATLFCPCLQQEVHVNPQKLAKELQAKGSSLTDGEDYQDDREPIEAILVCLDRSHSMSGLAGFQRQSQDNNSDKDSDSEEADEEQEEEEDDDDDDMHMANARRRTAKRGPLKAEEKACYEENLLSSARLRVLREVAAEVGVRALLKEMAAMETDKRVKAWLETLPTNLQAMLLPKNSSTAASAVGEQKTQTSTSTATGARKVPAELKCPITNQLLCEPVLSPHRPTQPMEKTPLQRYVQKYKKCPLSLLPLTLASIQPAPQTEGLLKSFKENSFESQAAVQGTAESGRPATTHSVLIKTLTGKNFCIDVSDIWTVGELAETVAEHENIPTNQIKLILAGRAITEDPERTLAERNIKKDTVIHLVLKMRPGSMQSEHDGLGKRGSIFVELAPDRRDHDDDDQEGKNHVLLVDPALQDVDLLLLRYWALKHRESRVLGSRCRPSKISLWYDLRDMGDSSRCGSHLDPTDTLPTGWLRAGWKLSLEDPRQLTVLNFKYNERAQRKREKLRRKELSRMDTVKQLFHAFINRSCAYDYPNHIGLLLFGSEVSLECELTPLYEQFRERIDGVEPEGDTKLYDALVRGVKELVKWRKSKHHPQTRLRLLVISDGEDTKSEAHPHKVAALLQKHNVLLDAIHLGARSSQDRSLKALVKATGGLCFAPQSLREALMLNELETLLSSLERQEQTPPAAVRAPWDLAPFSFMPDDVCNEHKQPARKEERKLLKAVLPMREHLQSMARLPALQLAGNVKRIMQELRQLAKDPHPSISLFPCEKDLAFWKALVQGPEGTPYAGGCWLLYLKFPELYPSQPPEVRFVTPIKHCNINCYGKVCHSVLDRNYSTDTSVRTILQCVFGLLLSPDVADPLDSTLALAFYDDSGLYETSIAEHTKLYAKRSLQSWQAELGGEDEAGGGDAVKKCARCGKGPPKLKLCSRCRQISYCGIDCQRKDWKEHKPVCSTTTQQVPAQP